MRCESEENEYEKVKRVIGELEHRPSLMEVSVATYLHKLGSQLLDRKGGPELMYRTNKLNKSE